MTSCDPAELANAARCFVCQTPNLDEIDILLLCILAGGTPIHHGLILGNPDEDFAFGDPNSGIVFGIP